MYDYLLIPDEQTKVSTPLATVLHTTASLPTTTQEATPRETQMNCISLEGAISLENTLEELCRKFSSKEETTSSPQGNSNNV